MTGKKSVSIEKPHAILADKESRMTRLSDANTSAFEGIAAPSSQSNAVPGKLLKIEKTVEAIYEQGQREKEVIDQIFLAIKDGRIEQAKLINTIKALRLWAKHFPKIGLSNDSLISAVKSLEQTIENKSEIDQYVEVNFPLIPGIAYKVEFRPDIKRHFYDLLEIWREMKRWVAE